MIFKNQGRPQGNINKKGYRDFPTSRPKILELLKTFKEPLTFIGTMKFLAKSLYVQTKSVPTI